MDDIVKQAMRKWPNVPHCYGWLALDGRGAWRMRDESVQAHNLPGDKITHRALVDFIHRNYTHDDAGNWYFQNGPQRVYVDLAIAPFIAHTDPVHGFVVQTNETLEDLTSAWITSSGTLFLVTNNMVAAVKDQDMALCLDMLAVDGHIVDDAYLLAWLEDTSLPENIILTPPNQPAIKLQRLIKRPAEHFGFNNTPRALR